ncbi:MAG TPA: leucine-rich repeat domain-containing protein [Flavobacteriales bacterium]|nr:leucine-rich repeat domain-containing protein [Flavobacteriales bacterium]
MKTLSLITLFVSVSILLRAQDTAEIKKLVLTIDEDADLLHSDFTPGVYKLGQMGTTAMEAVLPLLQSKNEMTRLHAHRVLELNVYVYYGYIIGKGFRINGAEDEVRNILNEINYDWQEYPWDENDTLIHQQGAARWANYVKTIHVYRRHLEELKRSTIPGYVFNMTHLKQLSITGMDCDYAVSDNKRNDTTCRALGGIPLEIAKLANLETLQLNVNNIRKIPGEIAALNKLKSIDLSDNTGINDITVLMKMENLEEMYFFGCGISSIPPGIVNLKKLKSLGLTGNPIAAKEIEWLRANLPGCRIIFEP